jgi:hypothetical protein
VAGPDEDSARHVPDEPYCGGLPPKTKPPNGSSTHFPGYLVPGKLFLNKDVCVEELSTGLADSLVEQLAGYLP